MRGKKRGLKGSGKRKRISPEISSIMHPTRQAIIDALEDHRRLTTIDLEKILQESRYNLYHHLNVLGQQGLIREKIEGKVKFYELAKETHVVSISTTELSEERKDLFIKKLNELLELSGGKPLPKGKEYRCIIVEESDENAPTFT